VLALNTYIQVLCIIEAIISVVMKSSTAPLSFFVNLMAWLFNRSFDPSLSIKDTTGWGKCELIEGWVD